MKIFVNRVKYLLLLGALTTAGTVGLTSNPVLAGTLHNGWTYGIDSYNDATSRASVGGATNVGDGPFEIFGIALNVGDNDISVALNSNLGVDGATVPYGSGYGHTGWGDLFLTNTDTGKSYGMRFTTNNASGVPELGLYEDISVTTVGVANDGWDSYSRYANFVRSQGGNPSMGDLAINDPLLGDTTNNIMTAGRKIGDITQADLTGLDFGHFNANGSQTFGFSFDRSLLEPGNYVAHVLEECANDGVAVRNKVHEEVPEPSTLLGLGSIGLLLASFRRRQVNTVS
jgi:hypothetical protein